MRRVGFLLKVRPDMLTEYKAHHQAVWPGVCARLREVGVQEMKIFLRDRRLFMFIETSDEFEPRRTGRDIS